MRTMLITDGSLGCKPTLWSKLEEVCQSGIDAIQIREKQATTKDLFLFAKKLRAVTSECGVALIINERVDVALAVDADGVHLPEFVSFPKVVLKVGRSVHSLKMAQIAEKEGAHYVQFGPIFPPLSKASQLPPQGLNRLEELSIAVKIPVIAVGGVTAETVPLLLDAGAAGIASVTALWETPQAFQIYFGKEKRKIQGICAILSDLSLARQVIQAGIDIVQFRHKGSYTQEQMDTARAIRALCDTAQIPFIVDDRCDVALQLDADGVHLGQSDLPISAARRLLGPYKIVGGTASTIEQALELEAAGADYVGLGHIFPTVSKQKDYAPIGLEVLRDAKKKLKIPIVAIGGISVQNAPKVIAQGVDAIAVISAITSSGLPEEIIQRLKRAFSFTTEPQTRV